MPSRCRRTTFGPCSASRPSDPATSRRLCARPATPVASSSEFRCGWRALSKWTLPFLREAAGIAPIVPAVSDLSAIDTARRATVRPPRPALSLPVVAVIGGAGKSGSLSLAAARDAGAARTIGIVPVQREADLLEAAGLADAVALADARDPVALSEAVAAAGGPADVTVVCVDVPGAEGGWVEVRDAAKAALPKEAPKPAGVREQQAAAE